MVGAGNNTRRNVRKHTHEANSSPANLEQSMEILHTHGAEQDNKTQVEQTWTRQNNQTWKGSNKGRKCGTGGGNKSSKWSRKQQAKRINKNLKHIKGC